MNEQRNKDYKKTGHHLHNYKVKNIYLRYLSGKNSDYNKILIH